ncbi:MULTISPECIES: glycerophosphodiester phosphodiesterase family protein [unclassified Paracoccus (in: a-proteobacteria)]|uniref:glycerophosphodiester phosphodiesterase family protein n=1 Tax=unclassified Paracoccus (in: a-proteobacteria) TaxID=2688777 RepID=UPI0012B22208|nr:MULTISPECIES: glycerophosphodiester phosphodiesterase family protein [unclassified Paracoccus (in: a-proteobacteria)]UXU75810.1 phosphodiesterase [Paracoccus sp. SMMA_5]UXU81719.1 phosphodiesterase [Paracoccus sp. SMMA_5_TC]
MELHPDFLRLPIAHRGLHDERLPENSLAAFRAAIAHGYGIECDIQRAMDNTPMVFHDYELGRLTDIENGTVAASTPAQLSRLHLRESDETIPTLAAALQEVAGRVPLLIEIKDPTIDSGPEVGALPERVAQALEGYKGPVAVMSFNPHVVAAFHRAAPQIAVGLTTCAFEAGEWPMLDAPTRQRLAAIADFDAVGACFISHDRADLDNPAVAALKARGVPVLTWTIRSPEAEAAARRVADNITFEHYHPAQP